MIATYRLQYCDYSSFSGNKLSGKITLPRFLNITIIIRACQGFLQFNWTLRRLLIAVLYFSLIEIVPILYQMSRHKPATFVGVSAK